MPFVPPWLDVHPADFAQAAQSGIRASLERRAQDMSAARSSEAMQMQQNQQQVQDQLMQQRLAQQQADQEARIGLATQAAARKYQAQEGYRQALASGADPIQAMMHFGPLMGQSMAGVGSLGMAQERERMASLPPNVLNDPTTGKPVGYWKGADIKMFPNSTVKVPLPGSLTKVQEDKLKTAHAIVNDQYNSYTPEQVAAAQAVIDRIYAESDGETAAGSAAPAAPADPIAGTGQEFDYDPASGKLVPRGR